jgi:hypothetical protein
VPTIVVDLYLNSGETVPEMQEIVEVLYGAVHKEFVERRELKNIQ